MTAIDDVTTGSGDVSLDARTGRLAVLARLGEKVAEAASRDELCRTVTEGVRALLACDGAALVLGQGADRETVATGRASGPPGADAFSLTVTLGAAGESGGELIATDSRPFSPEQDWLLRAVASQVVVALKWADLAERLARENPARQVFESLACANGRLARHRARQAHFDLDMPHRVLTAGPVRSDDRPWDVVRELLEHRMGLDVPGSVFDRSSRGLRALVPWAAGSDVASKLDAIGCELAVCLGYSEVATGADTGRTSIVQSEDTAKIAAVLRPDGGALGYEDLGVYKFLVHVPADKKPDDRLTQVLDRVEHYDNRRESSLVATLEIYLRHGSSPGATARALALHPNTIRQRLARIQAIGRFQLATEDPLELELAINLRRLHHMTRC